MFGKLAADALGLSDIGKIIDPKDFDKVDSDDYVLHEEGEKIYFLIKSKSDEYCFTNFGLIHLDGGSAVSKKRILKRYDFSRNALSEVQLETAGTVDLDVEIKFNLGAAAFSIDVQKNQIDLLKVLYKALTKIAMTQHRNQLYHDSVKESILTATNASLRNNAQADPVETFKGIYNYAFSIDSEAKERLYRADFKNIFEAYLKF